MSAEERPALFLRKATGLVRPWSYWDGFIYNTLAVNALVITSFSFVNGYGIAPAGNMLLAILIAGIFTIFLAYNQASLIATMPRSGGDYIFQSRILGGAPGYVMSWSLMMVQQPFLVGMAAAAWGGQVILSPFLTLFGSLYKVPALVDAGAWFSYGDGLFLFGVLTLTWNLIINLAGMVWYRRVQKACFYVGMSCLAVLLVILAVTPLDTFIAKFNDFAVNTYGLSPSVYSALQNKAYELGFSTQGDIVWSSIVMSIPYAMGFSFVAYSAFNAGEIKGAGSLKGQVYQTVGAAVASLVISALAWELLANTAGEMWYGAVSWLWWNHGAEYVAIAGPTSPFLAFLGGMIYPNAVVIIVVFLAFQAWYWMMIPNAFLATSRYQLAISFDRVWAEKAGKVHPKLKAPHVALGLVFLISTFACWLVAYTGFASWFALFSLIAIISFGASGLAGVLLPSRRKDLFEVSPARKWRLGVFPLVSICGGLWVLYTVIAAFGFFTSPGLFINDPTAITFLILVYVSGVIAYYAFKTYRRRKAGIDVTLLYKEIPVE
jgi:amino acid transporter